GRRVRAGNEPEFAATLVEGRAAPGHAARHHGRYPRALFGLRRTARWARRLRQGGQYSRLQESGGRHVGVWRGMTAYTTIRVQARGAVTLVTLIRPDALNALSGRVLEDLIAAFAAFEADESQRCAIVTGAGEKAFAAGADIKEMAEKGAAEFYREDTF